MNFTNAISLPNRLIRLFAVLLAALTLAACGGSGDGFPGVHTAPVGAVTALYTTAPSGGVTIAVAGSGVYTVGGGTPGYSVVTSNSAVATATLVDSTLTVNGVSGGSATIEVRDAAGATVSLSVTVTPAKTLPLFTTAPGTLTIALGTAPTYTIGGGTAPYTVTSSNILVSVANLIGASTLSITGTSVGSAQVVVLDSTGTSVPIAVSVVGSATPLYTTAPASGVTIGTTSAGIYTIGGGTPGYTAVTSNSAVAVPNVVGSTLTITGLSGGKVTVVVRDGAGATLSLPVTVGSGVGDFFINAPTELAIAPAAAPTYTIGGGSAPYAASSGNVAVATVSVSGTTFTITGVAVGTAQIVVGDSTGSQKTIAVTVRSGSDFVPLFTTAPNAITIATGAAPSYAIGGGSAPYTVISSNVIFATANVTTGTTLNIVGLAAGTASVVVTDAAGNKSNPILVTVSSATSTPLIATPSSATATVGDTLNFIVNGGSPAYSFVVNNPAIASVYPASVASNGGTFRVALLSAGSTTIAIVDALGQTATFTVTAVAPPTVVTPPAVTPAPTPLALSPIALSIAETYAAPIALNIQNGTGPYRAYTSDLVLSSVPTVPISGSTLTVGLGTQGNRCITPSAAYGTYAITITVVDALGASAFSTLTIKDTNGTCP